MLSTQTVRLYPTDEQTKTLEAWLWCARKVYNHFLENRIKRWKRRQENTSRYDQQKMLTVWRNNSERMQAVPLLVQRDALQRLDKAFQSFFRRVKSKVAKPGFPRFKGRDRWRSLNFGEPGNYVQERKIRVPKLGLVPCRNLRSCEGTLKSLRVLKRANKWYAQLLIEDGKQPPEKVPIQTAVGIDLGLESFATLSTGEQIPNPRWARKAAKKLRRANRKLSRKQKGSRRRACAKAKLAQFHAEIADARRDFCHKLSKKLVAENDLIAIEDLNIRGMARGHFAKSILDAAWGLLIFYLFYKAEKAGKTLVKVNPRGTSQICSSCGAHVPKPLSERWHRCPRCELSIHRDHNAARNALQLASVGREITRGERPPPSRRASPDGAPRRTVKSEMASHSSN